MLAAVEQGPGGSKGKGGEVGLFNLTSFLVRQGCVFLISPPFELWAACVLVKGADLTEERLLGIWRHAY